MNMPAHTVVSFEYDDPSADVALREARQYRLDGIPGLTDVWIEGSTPSEDQTVPGDQHHEVRAAFDVDAATPQAAARWVAARMRALAPLDDIVAVSVDGDWLPADDWIRSTR